MKKTGARMTQGGANVPPRPPLKYSPAIGLGSCPHVSSGCSLLHEELLVRIVHIIALTSSHVASVQLLLSHYVISLFYSFMEKKTFSYLVILSYI